MRVAIRREPWGTVGDFLDPDGNRCSLRDEEGHMGATACIVIPWFLRRHEEQGVSWEALAWWIHDHLPYSDMVFFSTLAFNLRWHEKPNRQIESHIAPKGYLTKRGMTNHEGDHSAAYPGFPELRLD